MQRVRIEVDSHDQLTVVKQMSSEDLFNHQVRWLADNRGPGVAVLERVSRATLTYSSQFVGSHTLQTWGLTPEVTGPILAQLVATLTRVHQRGCGHGRLHADHVVIGRQGPVLISPAVVPHVESVVEADIAALAHLLFERTQLWAVLATADDQVVEQWRSAAAAVAECRPGQHAQLAALVGPLAPRPHRPGRGL